MEKSIVKTVKPVDKLKIVLKAPSVQEQFNNALGNNSSAFIASLIDIFGSNNQLKNCDPGVVVMEALKAAVLKLPLNKNLGFAWLIAYNGKPVFQLGYKGLIQLALRTGSYKYLNTGAIYEGQTVNTDFLTGETKILGLPETETETGYFAYLELTNGFRKSVVWTKEKVIKHAKKYSKSYYKSLSLWKTEFSAMATKTMLINLLSKYGILSIEMAGAISNDREQDVVDFSEDVKKIIKNKSTKTFLDIDNPDTPNPVVDQPDTVGSNDLDF